MKSRVLGTAIGLLVLGLASQAPADNLSLSINGGAACLDNTACDSNATLGVLVVTTSFGTVTATGVGTGAPANNPLDLDLGYVISAALAAFIGGPTAPAGITTIEISENNLTTNGQSVAWTGLWGGTNGNTDSTVQAWAAAGNGLFTHTTSLCGPLASSAGAFALSCASGAFNDNSFSLSQLVTINRHEGQSLASGNFGISVVPEPGALLLVGSALAGIGLAGAGALRRRFGWTTA